MHRTTPAAGPIAWEPFRAHYERDPEPETHAIIVIAIEIYIV